MYINKFLKNVNTFKYKILLLFFITFLFIIPIILHLTGNDSFVLFLLTDGGIYETIGALSALMGSIIFLYIFWKNKKYIFYLIIGVSLLFLFFEEISWGQWIFKFNTPEYFIENNYQREFNIHNLNLFHNKNRALFDYGKYLIIIYFVYFTLLIKVFPFLKKYTSKFKIPIGSIFILTLLLLSRELNTIVNKIFLINTNSQDILRVGEIFETSIEIILLIFAIECYLYFSDSKYRNSKTLV